MANSLYDVEKMYLAYFGRPADPIGLYVWQNSDAATMQAGFAASAEYAALYSGMPPEQRVNQVYQNLLGRPAEPAGLAYWVNEFSAGRVNVGTLAQAIMNGAQGSDAQTIQNRIAYATSFTALLDTYQEITGYSGNVAASNARSAVASVTFSAASLTAALNSLTVVTAAIVTGTWPVVDNTQDAIAAAAALFNLTESGHAVTLTGSSTEAFAYTINGAATRAGSAVTASSGSLTNSVTSVDSSGYTGSSNITLAAGGNNVTGGTAADTLNVLGITVTGAIALGGGANHVTAATGAVLNTTITATGGTADLTLASGAAITMNAADYTLFNATGITALGSEQITLSDALTGAMTLAANVETFVLANGANDVKPGVGSQNVTAAGGNDTLDFGGLTITGTIDLGAGSNHVKASAGAIFNTTLLATGGGTADLTLTSGASVTMNAADYTLFNTTGITAPGTEQITFSNAVTGATVLNANVETFVLATGANSVATGATGQTINANALPAGQTLTMAGTHSATINLTAGNLTSTSSGNLTVTATGNNTIATAGGNDTITCGSGTNTINAGNGNNIVTLSSSSTGDNITVGTGYNTINLANNSSAILHLGPNANYNSDNVTPNIVIQNATAGNFIEFTGVPGLAQYTLENHAVADLTTLIHDLEVDLAGNSRAAVAQTFGGNTYIVESSTGVVGPTDTVIVKLVGIHGINISGGQIILSS